MNPETPLTFTAIWVSPFQLHQPSRHLKGKVREGALQKANSEDPRVSIHLGLTIGSLLHTAGTEMLRPIYLHGCLQCPPTSLLSPWQFKQSWSSSFFQQKDQRPIFHCSRPAFFELGQKPTLPKGFTITAIRELISKSPASICILLSKNSSARDPDCDGGTFIPSWRQADLHYLPFGKVLLSLYKSNAFAPPTSDLSNLHYPQGVKT